MSKPPMPPNGPRRLVLTGFMGSGKTTVGHALAKSLGWRFADLDDAVAAKVGISVPQIFAQQGEAAFRAAEVEALHALLRETEIVIALGGGAPETPAVRTALAAAQATAVIHLSGEFDVLYRRCTQDAADSAATDRPLLGSSAAALDRFARRQPLYREIAHHTVDAGDGPEQVVQAILTRVGTTPASG